MCTRWKTAFASEITRIAHATAPRPPPPTPHPRGKLYGVFSDDEQPVSTPFPAVLVQPPQLESGAEGGVGPAVPSARQRVYRWDQSNLRRGDRQGKEGGTKAEEKLLVSAACDDQQRLLITSSLIFRGCQKDCNYVGCFMSKCSSARQVLGGRKRRAEEC